MRFTTNPEIDLEPMDVHPSPTSIGLLRFPIVTNFVRCDRVEFRHKTTINKRSSRINRDNPVKGITDTMKQLNFTGLQSPTTESLKIKILKFKYLIKLRQRLLERISKYRKGLQILFLDHVGKTFVSYVNEFRLPFEGTQNASLEEMLNVVELFYKLIDWVISMKEPGGWQEIFERWTRVQKSSEMNKLPDLSTLADLLSMDEDKLLRFGFFRDPQFIIALRNATANEVIPDILKMVAFAFHQREEEKKCAYFLTSAHGSVLKTEIVDKRITNILRKEEELPPEEKPKETDSKDEKKRGRGLIMKLRLKPKPLDPEKDDLKSTFEKGPYVDQMKDLTAFDESSTSAFQKRLSEINLDWTIVQFTTMFNYQNRFYSDFAACLETPAMFLTCFAALYGKKDRAMFCTFIPEPVKNPGISRRSLIDEFAELMLQNRVISGGKQPRRTYWDTRAQHNQHLISILAAVEENWLFPWHFMFGGNLIDKSLQKSISDTVESIEIQLKKKLTSSQRIQLMKLIGNFNILKPQVQNSIGHLLSYILNTDMLPFKDIANCITKLGSSIPLSSKRHPTILILDQEIEQIPWDWLVCMRETSVTRIQSMAILYSTTKLLSRTPPVDPSRCSFILNPDGSLSNVEKRLKKYFSSRDTWKGMSGQRPLPKNIEDILTERKIYLYCGHGNGQTFYPEYLLQKIICSAIPLLMGCGSAQYKFNGPKLYSTSILNAYAIAMCPSVVGFLWEVTDVECDRVTVELLEHWAPAPEGTKLPEMIGFNTANKRPNVKCLPTAVRMSRRAATQFLTEAAIVNYGLPISVRQDSYNESKNLNSTIVLDD